MQDSATWALFDYYRLARFLLGRTSERFRFCDERNEKQVGLRVCEGTRQIVVVFQDAPSLGAKPSRFRRRSTNGSENVTIIAPGTATARCIYALNVSWYSPTPQRKISSVGNSMQESTRFEKDRTKRYGAIIKNDHSRPRDKKSDAGCCWSQIAVDGIIYSTSDLASYQLHVVRRVCSSLLSGKPSESRA